ncbi:MAG: anti-sigma factor [Actinomycetota bacterium]
MTRDHAEIEELLAVRSLGGLVGDDVGRLERELASHGDCGECRRLADEYDETAGRLGFALEPMPMEPGQADEILRRATHPATQEAAPAPPAIPIDELRARRSRPARTWPVLVAAAALVVLMISAVAIFGPLRSTGVKVSTNQTVVSFSGDAGELAMAYEPGKPGALFVGADFPDPGSGKVYEIWMLQGSTAVSGGCVRPHDGSIFAFVDADLGDTDQMAVTVEPDSCPSQPTSAPVQVSDPLVA